MTNTYPFVLETLPYDYGDLEPVIDTETMHLHHDKHHQTYLDNLNKFLVEKSELQGKTLEELLSSDFAPIKNNAGGVWNHNFFFAGMTKPDMGHLEGELLVALEKDFGSVDEFMKQFEAAALGRFGSGWAWLVKNKDGKLEILSTANQDNPLVDDKKPLLAIDVWEHAYYLKYKNKRADYVKAYWQVVNWNRVSELMK